MQSQNERLRVDLDSIVEQIELTVLPMEKELGALQRELALRLTHFQRYKSLNKGQRHVMRNWVSEICDILMVLGLYDDELREVIAQDVARDVGIKLDPDSDLSAVDQVSAYIKKLSEDEHQRFAAAFEKKLKSRIDQRVSKKFGKVRKNNSSVQDLFQDDLDMAQAQRDEQIEDYRAEIEADLREQMQREQNHFSNSIHGDPFLDELFGGFDGGYDDHPPLDDKPVIPHRKFDSDLFKRLFRKTARALHPDKEKDDEKREEKHSLMKTLLEARNQGDLLTIFQLHHEHVGEETNIDARDEKELAKVLQFHIQALTDEKQAIANESTLSEEAYETFYAPSKKARERNIAHHLGHIAAEKKELTSLLNSMVNLKTLKAELDDRSELEFFSPLDNSEFDDNYFSEFW